VDYVDYIVSCGAGSRTRRCRLLWHDSDPRRDAANQSLAERFADAQRVDPAVQVDLRSLARSGPSACNSLSPALLWHALRWRVGRESDPTGVAGSGFSELTDTTVTPT
jgi:hypothetical protein